MFVPFFKCQFTPFLPQVTKLYPSLPLHNEFPQKATTPPQHCQPLVGSIWAIYPPPSTNSQIIAHILTPPPHPTKGWMEESQNVAPEQKFPAHSIKIKHVKSSNSARLGPSLPWAPCHPLELKVLVILFNNPRKVPAPFLWSLRKYRALFWNPAKVTNKFPLLPLPAPSPGNEFPQVFS